MNKQFLVSAAYLKQTGKGNPAMPTPTASLFGLTSSNGTPTAENVKEAILVLDPLKKGQKLYLRAHLVLGASIPEGIPSVIEKTTVTYTRA